MKKSALLLLIFLEFAQFAHANEVAQCLGTFVLDNSPVTAKIYSDEGGSRIVIETAFDTVQSPAHIEIATDSSVAVSDNKFQMTFSVSQLRTASPVQAFRDGQFFVEDFYCVRVN